MPNNDNIQTGREQQILTSPQGGGANLTICPQERELKSYAITDIELKTISTSNNFSSLFFAIGSAFISTAVSLKISAIFQGSLTPRMSGVMDFGMPLCIGIGAFSFIIAALFWWNRHSTIDGVKTSQKN